MAVNAVVGIVCLSMNEQVSDLVQQLDALNPCAITELVLRNCLLGEPAELCAQISRCVRLRRLSCAACALPPSTLLNLMLERLQYLQQLELSLIQDPDALVDFEIESMRTIAMQMREVIRYHSLRRLYVEVGGDRNFELLSELLGLCPNLTELHVHVVRGTFSNALVQCDRLHELLGRLEMFTFTSELAAPVHFPYGPEQSLTFTNCAAVCANVRHDRPHDWWSCVELSHLELGCDRAIVLPSQLVVYAAGEQIAQTSLREARRRHSWERVRELCLLLLPERPHIVLYPKAGAECRFLLDALFFALDNVVELNVNSFHFRLDVNLEGLLLDSPLGRRLLALSVPPCWFPRQSSVRTLRVVCPNLRDLDVRVVSRGGSLLCASCNVLHRAMSVQEPSDSAKSLLPNSVARLTLFDVTYQVLLWYFEYYGAAATLRLAEWRFVGSQQHDRVFGLLGKCVAVRCLVLQHRDLLINNEHFQDSLSRMTSLRHLCLLTPMLYSDADALQCVRDSVACSAQLKCVHIHYRRDTDGSEQRVTWLNRRQGKGLLRGGPCFACCSTATFIGLVKPVNRDCEADL